MQRWLKRECEMGESPYIDNFLEDIEEVCKRHGMSISHEDGHGAFEVTLFNERKMKWLLSATDNM